MDDSYSLALAVQDASNISGVSHDLSKLVTMIRAEYERDNNGQSQCGEQEIAWSIHLRPRHVGNRKR